MKWLDRYFYYIFCLLNLDVFECFVISSKLKIPSLFIGQWEFFCKEVPEASEH